MEPLLGPIEPVSELIVSHTSPMKPSSDDPVLVPISPKPSTTKPVQVVTSSKDLVVSLPPAKDVVVQPKGAL
jgi:hypothetical protein